MKKKVFVVLGNQLFNPIYFDKFKKDHTFFMCEDFQLCSYQKHHKQKILLFLSSMRSFADELKSNKFDIFYKSIEEDDFKDRYSDKLLKLIKLNAIEEVSLYEVEDKFFEKQLLKALNKTKLNYLESPMFLSTRDEFKNYLKETKKPFMANFYKKQRIKLNILIESDGKPTGGKWSFDEDNRKKLPKDIRLPRKFEFNQTEHTVKLKDIVSKFFSDHPGSVENFWTCTTREDANKFFNFFLQNKIENFGDFEDAVDHRDNILFHSALSPQINLGLITPQEIISKLKSYKKIKLNSYEGYVRQIIGWREFIRGIYQNYDEKLENSNFFNHNRRMKKNWYDATTGLPPLDFSINNALKYGWTHHIERLMILCNIMNLCEIKPQLTYRWFMEMFIDSSDWVMSPNVFGMGLFSDGGIFASKPYICGSSYFMKMMDFKKGPWCDIMDGLYWRFIEKNKAFFKKNPRLSMMVKMLEKMKIERKDKIFSAANDFIERNTYED